MKRISVDCHYDKHECLNLDLQNDYSQYRLENMLLVFMMVYNFYIGKILECSCENQGSITEFTKRNNLNLYWISVSCFSCCWVSFENLI